MNLPPARKRWIPLLPLYGAGLVIALGLKFFYSRAGADDLNWILAPTCWLAGRLTGIPFEREVRAGWVTHSHRMIVGPGCAGLNFLVVSFSAFFFPLLHRFGRWTTRAAWPGAALAAAFLVTIAANAVRIVGAIYLQEMHLPSGVLTAARVHRIEGVVVYTLFLLLSYLALERVVRPATARKGRWTSSPLVPLGWYLAIALGVPLLNRAYRPDPARFLEHAAVVVVVCLFAALAGISVRRAVRRLGWKINRWAAGERAKGIPGGCDNIQAKFPPAPMARNP